MQVVRHTWREKSLDQSMGWFDPTVIAQATLPMVESPQQVEDKQAAAEKAGDRKARKKGSGGGAADADAGDAGDAAGPGETTGTGGDA